MDHMPWNKLSWESLKIFDSVIVYWGPSEVVKIMNLNKDDMVYLEMAVEFKSGNRKKVAVEKLGIN